MFATVVCAIVAVVVLALMGMYQPGKSLFE
jgi:hypothetical protein